MEISVTMKAEQTNQNQMEETVLLKLKTYERLIDNKTTLDWLVSKNLIEFIEDGKNKQFVCADKTDRLDNLAKANVRLIDKNISLRRSLDTAGKTRNIIETSNKINYDRLKIKNDQLLLNNKILAIVLISVVVLSYSCWFLI
tara:strand:- start:998 stop:1423 length:426 start_codon:yes stop_codon:yes gene_type:complete